MPASSVYPHYDGTKSKVFGIIQVVCGVASIVALTFIVTLGIGDRRDGHDGMFQFIFMIPGMLGGLVVSTNKVCKHRHEWLLMIRDVRVIIMVIIMTMCDF